MLSLWFSESVAVPASQLSQFRQAIDIVARRSSVAVARAHPPHPLSPNGRFRERHRASLAPPNLRVAATRARNHRDEVAPSRLYRVLRQHNRLIPNDTACRYWHINQFRTTYGQQNATLFRRPEIGVNFDEAAEIDVADLRRVQTRRARAHRSLARVGRVAGKLGAQVQSPQGRRLAALAGPRLERDLKTAYLAGPATIAELKERAAKEGGSILDYLSGYFARSSWAPSPRAPRRRSAFTLATLSGRLVEVLREIGKITGEIERLNPSVSITNTVAIFSDPKFLELQSGLLAIARAHPGARADIIALLRGLDARPAMPKPNGAHPPDDRRGGAACRITPPSPASPRRSKTTGRRSRDRATSAARRLVDWIIMAGRGFGKTRAGGEWVRSLAEAASVDRIALVGPTAADVGTRWWRAKAVCSHCPEFEPADL